MDEDSYAPIFEDVNKEVLLEYLRMYQYGLEMAPVGLPLPKAAQVFEKKRKKVIKMSIKEVDEEEETCANEDATNRIQ